ncbi:hypothetical protein HK405_006350, partial [Cladochytrium tenue]
QFFAPPPGFPLLRPSVVAPPFPLPPVAAPLYMRTASPVQPYMLALPPSPDLDEKFNGVESHADADRDSINQRRTWPYVIPPDAMKTKRTSLGGSHLFDGKTSDGNPVALDAPEAFSESAESIQRRNMLPWMRPVDLGDADNDKRHTSPLDIARNSRIVFGSSAVSAVTANVSAVPLVGYKSRMQGDGAAYLFEQNKSDEEEENDTYSARNAVDLDTATAGAIRSATSAVLFSFTTGKRLNKSEPKDLDSISTVRSFLKRGIGRTRQSRPRSGGVGDGAAYPAEADMGGTLDAGLAAEQAAYAAAVRTGTRFAEHVERGVYRLSHAKLTEPRRALREQVAISNLMLYILSVRADVTLDRAGGARRDARRRRRKRRRRKRKDVAAAAEGVAGPGGGEGGAEASAREWPATPAARAGGGAFSAVEEMGVAMIL